MIATVDEIKHAIATLGADDKADLASWLNLDTMDDWDRQMQRDFAPNGPGAKFVAQLKQEAAECLVSGTALTIEERFSERRQRGT